MKQVELNFILLADAVDSDDGSGLDAKRSNSSRALVPSRQNVIGAVHNERLNDAKALNALLQHAELFRVKLARVVISRY